MYAVRQMYDRIKRNESYKPLDHKTKCMTWTPENYRKGQSLNATTNTGKVFKFEMVVEGGVL